MNIVKNLFFIMMISSFAFMQDVVLSITNYSADTGQLEVSITNTQEVGGFQFDIDASFADFSVSGASGGAAADAGYTVSTNTGGLILGFSFSGATIPANSTPVPLVYVDVAFSGEEGAFNFSDATISDPNAQPLSTDFSSTYSLTSTVIPGCTDDALCDYDFDGIFDEFCACNYNSDATEDDGSCTYAEYGFDCDGNCTSVLDCFGVCGGSAVEGCDGGCNNFTELDDCGVCEGGNNLLFDYSGWDCGVNNEDCPDVDCSGVCFGTSIIDECGVCNGDGSTCVETHFNVGIAETGESTLFIFQDSITSLASGDEVGLFDANGIIDNDGNTGEILVGAGTWNGNQLEVTAIHAVDLSEFGGPILPGAVEGNPLSLKVWNMEDMLESDVTFTASSGSGTFNSLFTAISEIEFCEIPDGTCDCEGTLPIECWDGSTTCDNDCPLYFNVDIAETGESTLFIFQDSIATLSQGDELGLWDLNGISGVDSLGSAIYGPVLVGAGVWNNAQLEITAIHAVDLSEFGGPILPGAMEGNSMNLQVFKDGMVNDVTYSASAGTGSFNGLFTAIESIEFAPAYTVVINEFFFRANEDVPDYIELYNYGMESVDLSGWSITDGEDPFDGSFNNYVIGANEYLLLAGEDPFFNAAGDELVAGQDIGNSLQFDIGLSTSSDVMMLFDADGNEVDMVAYDADTGWAAGNDFRGRSLELSDPYSDNNDPSNWDSSTADGIYMATEDGEYGEDFGTPGEQNSNFTVPVPGCTDSLACNYDETATMDDGSCTYPDYYAGECDCDGNLTDCTGECGGDSFIDDCGNCVDEGTNPDDCLDADTLPTEFSLSQNYPNPFNPTTNIMFDVAENDNIQINIYDLKGQHISTLVSGYFSRGSYSVTWNGANDYGVGMPSGLYVYRLVYNEGVITKKMTLIR